MKEPGLLQVTGSLSMTEAECRKQGVRSLRSDAQKTSGGHITKEQDRNEKLEF